MDKWQKQAVADAIQALKSLNRPITRENIIAAQWDGEPDGWDDEAEEGFVPEQYRISPAPSVPYPGPQPYHLRRRT